MKNWQLALFGLVGAVAVFSSDQLIDYTPVRLVVRVLGYLAGIYCLITLKRRGFFTRTPR